MGFLGDFVSLNFMLMNLEILFINFCLFCNSNLFIDGNSANKILLQLQTINILRPRKSKLQSSYQQNFQTEENETKKAIIFFFPKEKANPKHNHTYNKA